MKKLIAIISFIAMASVAMAQTAEEIIARMESEMDKHNESEGVAMTIDIKIPFLGPMSTRTYYLGEKYRIEGTLMGKEIITWSDGTTEWTYNDDKEEIEIKNATPKEKSDTDGDIKMFDGITDGYDVSINKETDSEWHLRCKKSKKNPDKDAPKKIDLVIAKGTYWPVSLNTSMKGIDMTLREVEYGVTEEQVTFDPKAYPNATIVDNR